MASIEELKGKVLINCEVKRNGTGHNGEDEILLYCLTGEIYRMTYHQDCCATCAIEDIVGDVEDLHGLVIDAREESSDEDSPGAQKKDDYDESYTWTFYIIQTEKGAVTIRWYGSSNGYYSESASFERV